MKTRLPLALLLVAALAPAARTQSPDTPQPAAEAPPAPASAASSPAAGNGAALPTLFAAHTDAPAAAAPAGNRTVSPELANVLATGLPKYDPPKPADAAAEAADAPDLRDVDKPRNEIKRLPKYVVQAPKPPVFRERDLYTQAGQTALSFQRNPGLGLFPFSSLNSPIADQMYQDQERLNNISDLTDTARTMARGGDSAEGLYIMRAAQDTYMRDSIFGWNGSSIGQK